MKGITPVIAVILLLLITVAMVGFAFTWFTRISTTAAERIENQTERLLAIKTIRIENVVGTAVDIRNTGDGTINSGEMAFYVNNARVTATGANIAPNAVQTYTLASACPTGGQVRVTVTGGTDVTTCK